MEKSTIMSSMIMSSLTRSSKLKFLSKNDGRANMKERKGRNGSNPNRLRKKETKSEPKSIKLKEKEKEKEGLQKGKA